jgi:hypothetical protein
MRLILLSSGAVLIVLVPLFGAMACGREVNPTSRDSGDVSDVLVPETGKTEAASQDARPTIDSGGPEATVAEASAVDGCRPDSCLSSEYCTTRVNTIPDASVYSCIGIPSQCESAPSCSCLLNAPPIMCFMPQCSTNDAGELLMKCLPPPPP